tara:strand:+ start:63217 stop:64605 length:1389 start_codon:yes stop_codon:yes gene_type:complete
MNTRVTDFHFFLKSVSQRFTSMAIFNSEFKCLHIQTPFSNNSVGMMTGPKTLKNFFPWDGSHVIVHNDPLLGCSQSDRIQFIFSAESFHFCIEESFPNRWDFSKKMIKIPPIPIVENNRINNQLIDALTSQNDCPSGVREFFQTTLQKIEKFQFDFKNILKGHTNFTNKDLHKDYLGGVSSSSLKTIKSKTYVSSQIEYEFGPQSVLKLKTSTSELGIRVDFQGTTNHTTIQMPDSVTDSLCFNFFADYFQFNDLMNEATFSHFQIAKPTQSFVNSKTFTNKIYSDHCGADLINQALLDCWSEKTNLKPYLLQKTYFQLFNQNSLLEFNLENSKPVGSAGLTYNFEPLLASRPIPGMTMMPMLSDFSRMGVDVKSSQYSFRSPKAKEINDFQGIIELVVKQSVQVAFMKPCLPAKIKAGKVKSTLVKPLLNINEKLEESSFAIKDLSAGDQVRITSGALDFA